MRAMQTQDHTVFNLKAGCDFLVSNWHLCVHIMCMVAGVPGRVVGC